MANFIIRGGRKLKGKVKLSGNKNSALKIIPATLIADSPSTLTNVPQIRDIEVMLEIVEKLGAKITGKRTNTITIDPRALSSYIIDPELSARIRASVVLAAPLLVKFGKCVITPPGGDQIGERLLDTHFSMIKEFGVEIERKDGRYELEWKRKKPVDVFLEEASVTATEMGLILAAALDKPVKMEDVASEPHVKDLANFLSKMGANIKGAGTNILEIKGKRTIRGTEHKIIPDHIEGGTFIIASAITGGHILIEDFISKDYQMSCHYLQDMGINLKARKNNILEVFPSKLEARRRKFQTRPWPGFPTDLMSPFIVLATQTKGTVLCHDWMYEWRMFFVDDLTSMGANIFIADPHRVIVSGPSKLLADNLYSKDIRAGISMMLAALVAKGKSTIHNIEMIERGYENLLGKFKNLGADIKLEL